MSRPWPTVRLGEVLSHRKQFITIDDLQVYKRPRVQLHAQGIVIRDQVSGALIKTKTQQFCHEGDFLVAEIDAKVGGFGIVPKDIEGSIVSSHYFLFSSDTSRLDRQFLGWFVKTLGFREQVEAQGSTNYAAIRPTDVLGYKIPLPPLAEQRRIVARVEELSAKIAEVRSLRHQAAEEIEVLRRSAFDAFLTGNQTQRARLTELLAEPLINGLSFPSSKLGSGLCFAKVGCVNTGTFDPAETKLVDVDLAEDSPYWLQPGDVLVSRGNTPDLVGRAAVYVGHPPKCAMPDLLIRIRVSPTLADPQFVAAFFHSVEARDYIRSQIGGTSSTMPKISQPKLGAIQIPLPPLLEQRRIVAYLDMLQAKVDALKRLQTETAAEMDAMLPAILDRAFKGEL